MAYNGNKGRNGARPLAYWVAYSEILYGTDGPVTAELAAKAEEQGSDALVERSDDEMVAMLQSRNDEMLAQSA